jgi:hypothetical protein
LRAKADIPDQPRLTPTGIWILDEPLPVPQPPADIELVVEHPRAAPPIVKVNQSWRYRFWKAEFRL